VPSDADPVPSRPEPADSAKEQAVGPLLIEWAKSEGRAFPWREVGSTPYEVLVSELLLKRTTAQAASRVYGQFLAEFPDLAAITSASPDNLEAILSSVGLQRQRAHGFKAMAQFLVDHYGGVVPSDLDLLRTVPQVGEYAARAVLSFGYGKAAAVVDSNVVRVLGRLFSLSLGPDPKLARFQELADTVLPVHDHKRFNWGILDLGALVCRYDRPRCEICPLMSICDTNDYLYKIPPT
jgi:A/G-specific adenine glycosylase